MKYPFDSMKYPFEMCWRGLAFVAVFSILSPQRGQATDYHFSPYGDDAAGKGTEASPWATLKKASSLDLEPGDRILLEGGQTFWGSLLLTEEDGGTPQKPVVITSYATGKARIESGNETGIVVYNAGAVEVSDLVIMGSSFGGADKNGIMFYMDLPGDVKLEHVRISDVEVSGYGGSGLVIGSWNGLSGWKDVRVVGSAFHGNRDGMGTYAEKKGGIVDLYVGENVAYDNPGAAGFSNPSGSGIVIGGADGALVERNLAYGNGELNTNRAGPVGIWTYDSNDVLIQYNESYGNKTSGGDGGGFDLDGGVTSSVLQYNYSHDNEGPGYGLFQYPGAGLFEGNVVRYNISESDGGALHIWGGSLGMKSTLVYGNTFFTNSNVLVRVWGQAGGARLYNNLFVSHEGGRVVEATTSLDRLVFQGNGYWSADGAFEVQWGEETYAALDGWRQGTAQERVEGEDTGFYGDPGLVDPGRGGTIGDARRLQEVEAYRLVEGARARGAGLDLRNLIGEDVPRVGFYGTVLASGAYSVGAAQGGQESFADTQHIPLKSGWNLASLWVKPADANMGAVLSEVMSEVVVVKDAAGNILSPAYNIDNIGEWDVSEAYAIYARNPVTLSVKGQGIAPELQSITLHAGWNFVPYLRSMPMLVEKAMASIAHVLVMVKNNSGQIYFPEHGLDTIGEMQPGQGYRIYVTESISLSFAK